MEQMISKDSKSRLSAAEFMRKYRGENKYINNIIFMSMRYLGLLLTCTRNSPLYPFLKFFLGIIFPEQFYTFLKNYMSKFSMLPVLTSDEKISR